MSTTTTIGALGVAGVVAYAVWRSRQREEAPSGVAAACSALGLPPALCSALGGALGGAVAAAVNAVGDTVAPTPLSNNARLNGAVALDGRAANNEARRAQAALAGGTSITKYFSPVTSGGVTDTGPKALRFANGCTPFGAGSSGWAKCAPGTEDTRAPYPSQDKLAASAAYLSGVPYDPVTGGDPLTFRRAKRFDRSDGSEAWWDRGVERWCPPGTTIRSGGPHYQDHRPGAPSLEEQADEQRCVDVTTALPPRLPPGVVMPPPRPALDAPRPPISSPGAGYVWVSDGHGGGYWTRSAA